MRKRNHIYILLKNFEIPFQEFIQIPRYFYCKFNGIRESSIPKFLRQAMKILRCIENYTILCLIFNITLFVDILIS